MKKWWIYVFITFILALSAYAYSKDGGLEWLNSNADWTNGQIEDNAFALLALRSNGYNIDSGFNIMLQRKDNSNCYPAGNCNVKDTALAALALKQSNYDTKPLLDWLNSALTRASVTSWYIQIKTDKAGNCTITYDTNQVKGAYVNGTQKIKIANKQVDWINVETDLGANLDQPIEQIKVDCSQTNDPGIIISLLRIVQGNDFYIIQESQSSTSNLVINNACYPQYLGGQCNEEASFYAAYSLKKMNEEVKVSPYLLDKADSNLENAMLYVITGDQKYSDNLISNQNPGGYWDAESVYVTSFAINALKNTQYRDEVGNATAWIKSKQITTDPVNNGSFGDFRSTAVALYLALTDSSVSGGPGLPGTSTCGNNLKETGEQCDDGNTLSGDGCNSICLLESDEAVSCIEDSDCITGQECINQICVTERCTFDLDCASDELCDTFTGECKSRIIPDCGDGFCDTLTENENSCPSDCKFDEPSCGDGFCDTATETPELCPLDCGVTEEKNNTWLWALLIILIIGLGVGGYFAYNKFFKKPRQGNNNKGFPFTYDEQPKKERTAYQPARVSKRSNVDESLEKELDKSIKEAEKLLRK